VYALLAEQEVVDERPGLRVEELGVGLLPQPVGAVIRG
jgi:hypothetical protein